MTVQEHLLVILMEECSELQKLAAKALRFGPHEVWPEHPELGSNAQRMQQEWNDLVAVVELLRETGISLSCSGKEIEAKQLKIQNYMVYSRDQGTLDPA